MTRKVATAVTFHPKTQPGEEIPKESPFIISVQVLSTEKEDDTHFVPKVAQCTLDTGNHQGNMVSRNYLLDVLHRSESGFGELTDEELKGGTSASGHRIDPQGAVELTWYPSEGTRTFHDMRFLVCDNSPFDLVIGERFIRKHDLISPPNLAAQVGGGNRVKFSGSNTREYIALNGRVSNLVSKQEDMSDELEQARKRGNQKKIKELEEKLSVADRQRQVANLEFDLYKAEQNLGPTPTADDAKDLANLRKQLEEAKAKLPDAEEVPQRIQNEPNTKASGSSKDGGMFGRFRRRGGKSSNGA